jgi:hypothetical protein
MRYAFIILLLGATFCGCSKKQATTSLPAADLIVAGEDIHWHDGIVLHVTKRDGDLIDGIRLVFSTETTITADKGTIKRRSEPLMNGHDLISTNCVTLIFDEAQVHSGMTNLTMKDMKVLLYP